MDNKDLKDPASKIVELMKHGRPKKPRKNTKKTGLMPFDTSKIAIQGSGNIVLIGGESADLFRRVNELEQTVQGLLTMRQQTIVQNQKGLS